jgi:DNA polymerase III delta prime subunit
MTYLLITKENKIINTDCKALISKLWVRDISNKDLENNPDLHILDGSEIISIGIEEIKEIKGEMRYKPFKENTQIALILDAKKLTVQAQNAFLKTLEESPDTTAYILLVGSEKDLLATIISRSKKMYSKDIKDEHVEEKDLTQFCFENNNLIEAFSKIEALAKDKIECNTYLDNYLSSLQNFFRKSIKEGANIRKVTSKISLVNITKGQIEANGNRRLLLENLYLQIRNLG